MWLEQQSAVKFSVPRCECGGDSVDREQGEGKEVRVVGEEEGRKERPEGR